MEDAKHPETLIEALDYFASYENCHNFLVAIRWPDGVRCPHCGSPVVKYMPSVRRWQCYEKHERPQFSLKTGTIFEESPITLRKWLAAVWMIVNCKNGISSYEIHREIGVTQKTAWFMGHRIRTAIHVGSFDRLLGEDGDEVEVDETFIGGKARNMHADVKARRITGRGPNDKTAVLGMLERGGVVATKVVCDRKKRTLQKEVKATVAAGSALYSDDLASYDGLSRSYAHETVNHAIEYVRGRVHTNGMENFWSLLKRALSGTYVSVEPFHLHRYLDEQAYRYNQRKLTNGERFLSAVFGIFGRRLTYDQLRGRDRYRTPETLDCLPRPARGPKPHPA